MQLPLLTCLMAFCLSGPALGEGGWRVKKLVSMEYPDLAVQARVQGELAVECSIAADGAVATARVIQSYGIREGGRNLLEPRVLDNIKQWRFERTPEMRLTSAIVTLRYTFALENIEPGPRRLTRFAFEFPNRVHVSSAFMHATVH